VNIADFDLTKHVDVTKLNSRIESVAKELWQKFSDMFPFKPSNKVELQLYQRKAIVPLPTDKLSVLLQQLISQNQ